MNRISTLSIAVALCAFAAGSMAETAAPAKAKPAAKHAATKAAPKAAAETIAAPLSASQLETAKRVNTGQADCEFNQHVSVDAIEGKPGMFKVGFKNQNYTMTPEDTTTGAVRLEDKKNGIMWLQIANKSMLMNSKVGQRMVDNCVHPSQKS
jgi:cell wall-associated NlpC family hydrolase